MARHARPLTTTELRRELTRAIAAVESARAAIDKLAAQVRSQLTDEVLLAIVTERLGPPDPHPLDPCWDCGDDSPLWGCGWDDYHDRPQTYLCAPCLVAARPGLLGLAPTPTSDDTGETEHETDPIAPTVR